MRSTSSTMRSFAVGEGLFAWLAGATDVIIGVGCAAGMTRGTRYLRASSRISQTHHSQSISGDSDFCSSDRSQDKRRRRHCCRCRSGCCSQGWQPAIAHAEAAKAPEGISLGLGLQSVAKMVVDKVRPKTARPTPLPGCACACVCPWLSALVALRSLLPQFNGGTLH